MNNAQVMNDANNSAVTEQENTKDLRRNEETGASGARQEVVDEVSTITSSSSSSSSSPRSVLPIPHKTEADQEINLGVQQSDMENVIQESVNGEGSLESMSQNVQPSIDDSTDESHNGDLIHSQV